MSVKSLRLVKAIEQDNIDEISESVAGVIRENVVGTLAERKQNLAKSILIDEGPRQFELPSDVQEQFESNFGVSPIEEENVPTFLNIVEQAANEGVSKELIFEDNTRLDVSPGDARLFLSTMSQLNSRNQQRFVSKAAESKKTFGKVLQFASRV